ncbi:MAG: hypothetical protein K2I44_11040 [Muribaculaceae bacterium]|nr:hypothetical protein [Muribaculaceae bacterium]
MFKFRYLFHMAAVVLPLMLSGCEQDLDLDRYKNPEMEKMYVVNSILNPDSVIGVSVTHPIFFSTHQIAFNHV